MKGMFVSMAGLGVGGAAIFGTMDSPDFERRINRSPTAVYSAFSAAMPSGSVGEAASDGMPAMMMRTVKQEGRSITFELLFDDRPAVTAELNFEPADDTGTATRMTAEVDINAYAIGSAFETEAGMALSLVPDSYVDARFADMMNEMVDEIEAGRALGPLGADRVGVRRRDSADVGDRRADARRAQREAVRPMSQATPMVDPNAAAEAYREGRPNPNGYSN